SDKLSVIPAVSSCLLTLAPFDLDPRREQILQLEPHSDYEARSQLGWRTPFTSAKMFGCSPGECRFIDLRQTLDLLSPQMFSDHKSSMRISSRQSEGRYRCPSVACIFIPTDVIDCKFKRISGGGQSDGTSSNECSELGLGNRCGNRRFGCGG